MKNLQHTFQGMAIVILCHFSATYLNAQSPQTPSNPVCGSDLRMQMSISATPDGQMKWDEKEEYLTNYLRYLQSKAMPPEPVLGENYFVIPVVFHIIHSTGDVVGVGSNISYEQIISQMNGSTKNLEGATRENLRVFPFALLEILRLLRQLGIVPMSLVCAGILPIQQQCTL